MAIVNVRNESTKFVRISEQEFVHKPADNTEDITQSLSGITSNLVFEIFSDESASLPEGNYSLIFRENDGCFVSLNNSSGVKVLGDSNFLGNIEVLASEEIKLLNWEDLQSDTVINLVLKTA